MRNGKWALLTMVAMLASTSAARAGEPAAGAAPEARTGWAAPGAVAGFTLAAGVLGMAVASDAKQSHGGDGTGLGTAAVVTTVVALPLVALARSSTDGRGSPTLRILGYSSICVGLGIGGYLLGTSLKSGATYPSGLVTAVGASAALGISLLSIEALMARGDAIRDSAGTSRALALTVPILSVAPNAAGGLDGVIGFARAF